MLDKLDCVIISKAKEIITACLCCFRRYWLSCGVAGGWSDGRSGETGLGNEIRGAPQSSALFYALLHCLARFDLRRQCDFKLLYRAVLDAYIAFLKLSRASHRLIHWMHYPSAQLPFFVSEHARGGGSLWSPLKLLRFAINNITSFSSLPLRLVSTLGSVRPCTSVEPSV